MADPAYRNAGFPRQPFWIRWIDFDPISSRAANTANLVVSCALLPDGVDRSVPLADAAIARSIQHVEARVSAGVLPHLVIGDIYVDGARVGSLPCPHRTFRFMLPADDRGSRQASEHLTAGVYPLGRFFKGRCLVLENAASGEAAILPASEAIRTFMAPNSIIAAPLLSTVWPMGLDLLVDKDETRLKPDPDGRGSPIWSVALRRGVPNTEAETVARFVGNMMATFNPAGQAAADAIHGEKRASAHLPGVVPFTDCELCFTARGFPTPRGQWFAVEIVRASWPHRNPVEAVLEQPKPLPPGYDPKIRAIGGPEAALIGCDDLETVTPDSDPHIGRAPLDLRDRGVKWDDLPPARRAVRPAQGPTDLTLQRPDQTAHEVAVGSASSNRSVAAARTSTMPPPAACPRFETLAAMLDALKRSGDVASWRTIIAPSRPGRRGTRDVWNFAIPRTRAGLPAARHWTRLDDPDRPRSALLCEVTIGSRQVYWLELETSGMERFASLLFSLPGYSSNLTATVAALMALAIKKRGVWGENLSSTVGVRRFERWTHGRTGGSADTAKRALAAMSRV